MVGGDHTPAITQHADFFTAGVDHRLDRENHAGLHRHAGIGFAVMQNLWLFMKFFTDAVAAKFTHHAKALFLSKRLNRVANFAQ